MSLTLSERLLLAINQGQHALCANLISQGAGLNERGAGIYGKAEYYMLPLDAAAKRGDSRMCKILVDAGAAVDATDKDGHTALHIAASGGFARTCEVLIAAGAQVSASDRLLKRPLHHAAGKGASETCRVLIAAGASVHEVDDNERVPLHEAAAGRRDETCRLLIEAGANPNNTSAAGDTPLHCAVEKGHLSTCKVLVELGADPGYMPSEPWRYYTTPFQTALEFGRLDIARDFILECDEDPEQRTFGGDVMEDIVKKSCKDLFLALCTEIAISRAMSDGGVSGRVSGPMKSSSMSPL